MDYRVEEEFKAYPNGSFTFGVGAGTKGHGSLTVTRVFKKTISVAVNNWATQMGVEITADQARKLAAALISAADVLEEENV